MNTHYDSPFGALTLQRYPLFKNSKAQQNLQAWEGADTLLLEELSKHDLSNKRILILNDQFGAISCALRAFDITIQTDSFLSSTAIRLNTQANTKQEPEKLVPSTTSLEGSFDLVVIKIPKSLSFLEDQLYAIRKHINEHSVVIASAMVKSLSKNTRDIFEKLLGPSEQSLASRKSRLIHCNPSPNKWKGQSPFPRSYSTHGLELSCDANVFAEGRLDPGTRVFLDYLQELPKAETIIDLACGSGIMGIMCAQTIEPKHTYFCDESFMAVASTTRNASRYLSERFSASCANNIPESYPKVDLIVCNPPFHQQQTMSTDIAMSMFKNAYRQLKRNGEFWVVANRHLGYHTALKKLFGNCENIAKHAKYVVLRCKRID
ncbi:MAG: methyltransferase [Oleiphilaceae bacterium]|nr:methyltransferase [Oleiphilaceae bacterium]